MNHKLTSEQINRIMNLLKDITKLNEIMDLDDDSKPLWDQIESIYVECLKEGDKNLELNESPLH